MNQTTNYELSLYEGTDLFNPLTVENVNFNDLDSIIKAISNRAFSAATELLTGTVHAITRADSDCAAFIFPATANFTAGETFTVDGVQVTALLPSGTTLPTGAYVIGSNVLCVLNGTLMTVYCDAGSDAQTLQGHAASYFATDDDLDTLSGTVSNLSIKVGSAVLTTTAPDCSGAINELNTQLTNVGVGVYLNATKTVDIDITLNFNDYKYLVVACFVPLNDPTKVRLYNTVIVPTNLFLYNMPSISSNVSTMNAELVYKDSTHVTLKCINPLTGFGAIAYGVK